MICIRVLLLVLLVSTSAIAQNPIHPPGTYLADPTARVFDGRVYVYTTVMYPDTAGHYVSHYHALSSDDMLNWTFHERIFSGSGYDDKISYSDQALWAPDVIERNGVYYLYYCMANRHHAEGVATSDSPLGPFGEGQRINMYGYEEIDPAVFIDDDGQAYYLWGQINLKMARLMPSMTEIDSTSIVPSMLTETEHHFHEGAFMFKRNGIYYIIYSEISRAGMPTSIGYATSSSATGPYTYRGVIIDNDHMAPGAWNNHGSMIEFKGDWYIFYHRSINQDWQLRKVGVERVSFNEDGSIPEVKPTSSGVAPTIDATSTIEAEHNHVMYGQVFIRPDALNSEVLTNIAHRDRAGYSWIDFRDGVSRVYFRVKPGAFEGRIVLSTGKSWYPRISQVIVPSRTETMDDWITVSADVDAISGVHELWLTFFTDGKTGVYEVDHFRFEK